MKGVGGGGGGGGVIVIFCIWAWRGIGYIWLDIIQINIQILRVLNILFYPPPLQFS